MHKKKDELRDIYRSSEHDFEKDFTPQIAKDRLAERQRDLRRSRFLSLFSGILAAALIVALLSVAVRDFSSQRAPVRQAQTALIPQRTLPADALWIMDDSPSALQPSGGGNREPDSLSAEKIKTAAYHIISGQQALHSNEKKQALEHFRKVVENYPDMEGLHGAMGALYLQNGEYTQAVYHLEKARQEEESFDAVNNLGSVRTGAQEYDKAEKNLKRALELKPENPGCHKNLAVLYRKMNRDSDAIHHFEKYFDMQPNDPDTMQTYALYLTELGRWKEAADILTRLTQEVTDVAPTYFLLAQVQIRNGQQEKALAALKRGTQLIDPKLALAWMSREEFNTVRGSGEFKALIDQLQIASGSLNGSR